MEEMKNRFLSKKTWEKVFYFLRFKSPAEGGKAINTEDIPAIIIVVIITFLVLIVAIIISLLL